MKKLLFTFAILIVLFASCAKETVYITDTGGGTTPGGGNAGGGNQPSDGLSGTSWRLVSATSKMEFDPTMIIDLDMFTILPECSKDDFVTFNANGTAVSDEGAVRCDANGPQTKDGGTWKLSADKKLLSMYTTVPNAAGLTKVDAEILQLDEKVLKFKVNVTINGVKENNLYGYVRVK